MNEQTLCNGCKSSVTKEYLLCDGEGLFISFDTAQEAFDWIAEHTPNSTTHIRITKEDSEESKKIVRQGLTEQREAREQRIAEYYNSNVSCSDITSGF